MLGKPISSFSIACGGISYSVTESISIIYTFYKKIYKKEVDTKDRYGLQRFLCVPKIIQGSFEFVCDIRAARLLPQDLRIPSAVKQIINKI